MIRSVLLVATTCFAVAAVADEPAQAKKTEKTPLPGLTVSKEVTHILGPLDEHGRVDYVKALNEITSKGVTPENNFEVIVRQVMGPEPIVESQREEYYEKLGVKANRDNLMVDYFQTLDESARGEEAYDNFDRGLEGPWTDEDSPSLATWIKSIDSQLDLLVEGSKRTHYYAPKIADIDLGLDDQTGPPVISLLLSSITDLRSIARNLSIRANYRVAQGELDKAWEDVMAVSRVGRLATKDSFLISQLVGIAVDSMAIETATHVLQSPKLTKEQANRYLADLKQLPTIPPLYLCIDQGERYAGLDAVQWISQTTNLIKAMSLLNALSAQVPDTSVTYVVVQDQPAKEEQAKAPFSGALINWDETAKVMNSWYDRLVDAAKIEDIKQRKQAMQKINEDLENLGKRWKQPSFLMMASLVLQKPEAQGKIVGELLVSLLLPALDACSRAERDSMSKTDALHLAFACKAYQLNKGAFPETLKDLSPELIEEIPLDSNSGNSFIYKKTDAGIVVYSVGRNGLDDKARSYDDRDEDSNVDWDDFVINVNAN